MIVLKNRSWTVGCAMLLVVIMVSTAGGDSWVQNPANGHYYLPVTFAPGQNALSWTNSRAEAQTLIAPGGLSVDLVTIISQAEANWLSTTFADLDHYWFGGYQNPHYAYELEDPAANWHWVTGEPWAYTNWDPAWPEPNNMGDEWCLAGWTTDGKWNDWKNDPLAETGEAPAVGYIAESTAIPLPTALPGGVALAFGCLLARRR